MNPIIASPSSWKNLRDSIRREIEAKHQAELRASGFWRSLLLRWRIEREVHAELKRLLPPSALYGASASPEPRGRMF